MLEGMLQELRVRRDAAAEARVSALLRRLSTEQRIESILELTSTSRWSNRSPTDGCPLIELDLSLTRNEMRVPRPIDARAVCRSIRARYDTFRISGWSALGINQVDFEGLSVEPDLEFVLVFARMIERELVAPTHQPLTVFLADGLLAFSARIDSERAVAVLTIGYPGAVAVADVELQSFLLKWRSLVSQAELAAR